MRRRTLGLVVIACAIIALVFAGSDEWRGDGAPRGGRVAAVAARGRVVAMPEPAPHPPGMPALRDRIATMVGERGIPDDAREALSALGADLLDLREKEKRTLGDVALRAQIDDERRAAGQRTREILDALPASYRAAMRRHRVSVRQLAEWTAKQPASPP